MGMKAQKGMAMGNPADHLGAGGSKGTGKKPKQVYNQAETGKKMKCCYEGSTVTGKKPKKVY